MIPKKAAFILEPQLGRSLLVDFMNAGIQYAVHYVTKLVRAVLVAQQKRHGEVASLSTNALAEHGMIQLRDEDCFRQCFEGNAKGEVFVY